MINTILAIAAIGSTVWLMVNVIMFKPRPRLIEGVSLMLFWVIVFLLMYSIIGSEAIASHPWVKAAIFFSASAVTEILWMSYQQYKEDKEK